MKNLKLKSNKKEYYLDNIEKKLFDKRKKINRKKQINFKFEKYNIN